jgi:formylglycine-generating enzyme required for sulfatase activity
MDLLQRQDRTERRDQPYLWDREGYADWVGDNQPVVGICWYEARAYCRWLAALWRVDGLAGVPGGVPEGYAVRLPTEAEWEAAARGREGRRYPWGPDFDAGSANTLEGRVLRVSPVGAYPDGSATCGALDLSGNTWEWTLSLWGDDPDTTAFPYPYQPQDGRENPEADPGVLRVVRGGSWSDNQRGARCAYRYYDNPFNRFNLLGFRVVIASPISLGG